MRFLFLFAALFCFSQTQAQMGFRSVGPSIHMDSLTFRVGDSIRTGQPAGPGQFNHIFTKPTLLNPSLVQAPAQEAGQLFQILDIVSPKKEQKYYLVIKRNVVIYMADVAQALHSGEIVTP